jgi:hypothetical protein
MHERCVQEFVHRIDQRGREIASGRSRLVGDYDGKESVAVQQPHRLCDTGENYEPAHMIDVPHLLVYSAVSIKE